MDFSENEEAKFELRPGDVLVCEGGEPGRAAVWSGQFSPCFYQKALLRLRPRTAVADPHFIMFRLWLGSMTEEFTRDHARTTIAHLPEVRLRTVRIGIPSMTEQKRIVDLLSQGMARIERARAAAEARVAASGALRHAILRSAFSAGSVQRWPAARLENAAAIVSGVTLGRRLPVGQLRTVPYLTVANVKDGYLQLEDVRSVEVTQAELEKWRLVPGDLLLTEGGDPDKLGRGTIWQGEIADCIHQNHIFRVRFPPQEVLPEFVAAQVSSPYGKAYFAAHAKQTTGIATINQRVLRAFPLLRPPLSEQERIVAELRMQFQEIGRLERHAKEQTTAINALPAALLQHAFGSA
jgi:type I restriction enzyme S subunit